MSVEQKDSTIIMRVTDRKFWEKSLIVIGVALAILMVMIVFHKRSYTDIYEPDAFNVAHIARNIATGEGFTTHYIRPFYVALNNREEIGTHTELSMAPLHPYAVGMVFKLLSVSGENLVRVSLVFTFLTTLAIYFLGKLLFDWKAGLLASAAFGLSAQVMDAGTSGLEWPMATLWLTLLLYFVAIHHIAAAREQGKLALVGVLGSAVMVALLYMTHHALVFLMIPLAVYFAVTGKRKRLHAIVFLALTLAAVAPWAYRNHEVTGFPVLGATAWDIMAETKVFPTNELYRSTDAENREITRLMRFPLDNFGAFTSKIVVKGRDLMTDLIGVLGFAALPFALVGVLYKFKSPQANAVRGVCYGIIPVLAFILTVYSVHRHAVLLFAPSIAVFASAYFMLLLGAKKLHPFYSKSVAAGFLLLVCFPTIALCIWPKEYTLDETDFSSREIFSWLARGGHKSAVYTDVPWMSAWYIDADSVLLPKSDSDVWELGARGFPMTTVLLTPECGKYQPTDIWWTIHKVRLWREYIMDPERGVKTFLKEARILPEKAAMFEKDFRWVKRSFKLSESLEGARIFTLDPRSPDDIQIINITPRLP